LLPIPVSEIPTNVGWPVLRTIWRYSMDGNQSVEIRLNPPPLGNYFDVSTDGNWIAYSYDSHKYVAGETGPHEPYGVYLGDLRAGTSQLLDVAGIHDYPLFYSWSPDSEHFIFDEALSRLFIGNIHRKTDPINGGSFMGWVDASRYLIGRTATMGEIDKEMLVMTVQLPASYLTDMYNRSLTFVFQKH